MRSSAFLIVIGVWYAIAPSPSRDGRDANRLGGLVAGPARRPARDYRWLARPTRNWAVTSWGHRRTVGRTARAGSPGRIATLLQRRRWRNTSRARSRLAPLQRAHAPTVLIQPCTVPTPRAGRERGSTWSTVHAPPAAPQYEQGSRRRSACHAS